MKKNYLKPESEIVGVKLFGSVLEKEHGGLDVVSGEGNGNMYVGAKDNGDGVWDDVDEDEPISKPNLWEDDDDSSEN